MIIGLDDSVAIRRDLYEYAWFCQPSRLFGRVG
jgi:hypothetical protein